MFSFARYSIADIISASRRDLWVYAMRWFESLEYRCHFAVDPTIEISTPNRTAAEPGDDVGIFVIQRDYDFDDPLTVRVRISGRAGNGIDYAELDDEVSIPAGKRRLRIRVTPLDDNDVEATEGVRLTLRNSDRYVIGADDVATVRISDNDVTTTPPPTVTVTATDSTAAEANRSTGTFTFNRTGETSEDLRVDFSLNGVAKNGIDFDDLGSFVVIPAGEQSAAVIVRPIDDDFIEGIESFELEINPSAAYVVGSLKEDTISIADNDAPRPSSTINWTGVKASPIRRFESPSAVVDGRVYVFGGWYWDSAAGILRASQRVDAYDPASNAWSTKASMPVKLTHQAVVVDGRTIYMIGGFIGDDPGVATDNIWKYDTSANKWSVANFELPAARASGGAVIVGRRLHWFGGSTADRVTDSGKHWAIDLDDTSAGWTELDVMPNGRHHFAYATTGGKIYAFGGQHGHDSNSRSQDDSAHVYDPADDEWTALRTMPRPVSHAEPSTFVMNGKIYIAGGMTTGRESINNLTEYDPETDRYRELTPLPSAVTAPVVQYVDGKIFFTAGTAAVGGAQNKSWIGNFA